MSTNVDRSKQGDLSGGASRYMLHVRHLSRYGLDRLCTKNSSKPYERNTIRRLPRNDLPRETLVLTEAEGSVPDAQPLNQRKQVGS